LTGTGGASEVQTINISGLWWSNFCCKTPQPCRICSV